MARKKHSLQADSKWVSYVEEHYGKKTAYVFSWLCDIALPNWETVGRPAVAISPSEYKDLKITYYSWRKALANLEGCGAISTWRDDYMTIIVEITDKPVCFGRDARSKQRARAN